MAQQEMVVGAHLYQPPRTVEHELFSGVRTDPNGVDWTDTIFHQSYLPLADNGSIQQLSLDLYGTLRHDLETLSHGALEKYHEAMRENGVGDPYLHILLPDLSRNDKAIIIGAGLQAFQEETGVFPRFFWPPETALDDETLEVLAESGYEGFLCAPEQIVRDDRQPADNKPTRITLANGRIIIAIPFDRSVSGDLGFQKKDDADTFTREYILPSFAKTARGQTLFTWTDGETFGHHWKFGDKFLQYLVYHSLPDNGVLPQSINRLHWNESELGTGHLVRRSAWSCPHGDLRRWHGSCGCCAGDTRWKKPFHETFRALHRQVGDIVQPTFGHGGFEHAMITQFQSALYNRGNQMSNPELSLLAAYASSLSAQTSCGTFFDTPHTSGRINILFGLQTIEHMRDSGLHRAAGELGNTFYANLSQVPDPTRPGKTGVDIAKEMIQ